MKKIIHLIAAARPNFMKIAPLYHALKKEDWAEPVIVHTGQHYDANMSEAFFADLMLPASRHHLGVGSGTHAEQTGRVMIAYEKLLMDSVPELVVVVGDVNSTVACTLAAVKLGIRVAHLEAGLRSFDRSMPEEINRILTDQMADILWTPSGDGDKNLLEEGIAAHRIELVGNIMIDSLEMMRARIEAEHAAGHYGLSKGGYGLVTLHRPANVDSQDKLKAICAALTNVSSRLPLIFPVHPRTLKNLNQNGLWQALSSAPQIYLDEPIPYIRFMSLLFDSRLLITDSGGIQEETTYLGIPCLTLRPNTERPVTISQGTNRLCTIDGIEGAVAQVLGRQPHSAGAPKYWDGQTARRVVRSIEKSI